MQVGTYKLDSKTAYEIVKHALYSGIRYIDTAQLYKNEASVGKAVEDYLNETKQTFAESKIYVTTKVSDKNSKTAESISSSIVKSLHDLRGYCSCILLHNPVKNYISAYAELLHWCSTTNLDIGVSNFQIEHLEKISNIRVPKYNQIEVHPYGQNTKLISYCREKNIKVISHTCLMKGLPLYIEHEILRELSTKYSCQPAQILIAWQLYKDLNPIIGTSSTSHLDENNKIISLEVEDIGKIDTLDINHYFY